MLMERDFKWVRVPKEIWLSEDINMMCKMLLVEIDSLSKTDEGCYASNEYFSQFLWISKIQVSNYISILKQKWYVKEVSFDWRKRVLTSCFDFKADLKKTLRQSYRKLEGRVKENFNHINIYNNIENNNINNINSEAENQTGLDIVPLIEQTPQVPVTPPYKKRTDIDNLIGRLKETCNSMGVAYDKTKERMFAKHILDSKEFGIMCENINQERIQFAVNVLLASIKIHYFKGACSGPMKIYQNYVDVYNQTIMKHSKQSSSVWFLPWLN